jgi:hypothetical protein
MFVLGIKYNIYLYIGDIVMVVSELADKKILLKMVAFDRNMQRIID